MRKAVVCLVLLVFASCLRAEDYVYVLGPADTLTAVPDDAVAGWQIAADGVRLSLVSGKTLLVPEARKVVRECPVRLPRFSFFRYNDKHNDQLFQDVVASETDLLKDTVRLQVVQIGRYLTPTFGLTDSDAEAWIGLQRQESKVSRRNMSVPATYTLGRRCWRRLSIEDDGQGLTVYRYVPFGREVTVEVDFPTTSSTLAKVPCINITTKTGAVPLSKTSFISATISIQGGIFPDMPTTDILIKGRGNSSWSGSSRSKNSYHFKFSEKQKPLGMKAGKHWVLLGNKQTGSMLCNAVGHKVSALAGCDAPCHIVPVELYINGTYRGSYNLTEKVGLKNNSVNLDDESCAAMLELDTYDDVAIFPDNAYRVSTKIHDPDFDEEDSLLNITMQDILYDWQTALETLRYGSDDECLNHFDLQSLVSFLMVNDLCINFEFTHPKSVFLYSENVIDADAFSVAPDPTPWHMGPTWDWDWAFGYRQTSATYFENCKEKSFFGSLMNKVNGLWYDLRYRHPAVDEAYFRLWHSFIGDGRLDELCSYVVDFYNYAAPSFRHNVQSFCSEKDNTAYVTLSRRAASWLRGRANYIYDSLTPYDIPTPDADPQPEPIIIDTPDGIGNLAEKAPSSFGKAGREWFDINGRSVPFGSGRKGIFINSDGRKVLVP